MAARTKMKLCIEAVQNMLEQWWELQLQENHETKISQQNQELFPQ